MKGPGCEQTGCEVPSGERQNPERDTRAKMEPAPDDAAQPAATRVVRRMRAASRNTPSATRLKEDLRRRCLARVAEQRATLVSQRRRAHIAIEADGCEMDTLATGRADAIGSTAAAPSNTPIAWTEADEARLQAQLGHEGYLELMAATEEALLRELEQDLTCLGEDASATREYDDYLAAEEQYAFAQMAAGECDDGVLCPVCFQANLQLDAEGFVACAARCGLYLDARQAAGHPLELLRSRLNALHLDHGQRCGGMVACRMTAPGAEQAALGPLAFGCDVCGYCARVV